jgi:hypothetical protein
MLVLGLVSGFLLALPEALMWRLVLLALGIGWDELFVLRWVSGLVLQFGCLLVWAALLSGMLWVLG